MLVDSLAVARLLWATGGVGSGLGILLILPVGAMSVLASNRYAVFLAAIAAIALLLQQSASQLSGDSAGNDYLIAGVLGAVVFMVALLVRPLANRLIESEALVRRQEIDLANLAQLSQYIVQHLRESILVVDVDDRIRLINESAAQMLGDRTAWPGALLGEASPRLLFLMSTWRSRGDVDAGGPGTLPAADGARDDPAAFRARWAAASARRCSIFLEDTSLLAEKVQQSKLAALGRLSASIAHEIRNPVGAMSHAAQLLQESPALSAEDRRLTEIIHTNAAARQPHHRERAAVLRARREQAASTIDAACVSSSSSESISARRAAARRAARLRSRTARARMEVRADPTQLHQILWNLCQNAITHALQRRRPADVRGRRVGPPVVNGRPVRRSGRSRPRHRGGGCRAHFRAVLHARDERHRTRPVPGARAGRRPMAPHCCTSRASAAAALFRIVFPRSRSLGRGR